MEYNGIPDPPFGAARTYIIWKDGGLASLASCQARVGGGWWVVGGDAVRQCAEQRVKGLTASSGAASSFIFRRCSSYVRNKGRYLSSLLSSRIAIWICFLVFAPICKPNKPEVTKAMAAAVVVVVVVVNSPYLPSVPHLPLYSPGLPS